MERKNRREKSATTNYPEYVEHEEEEEENDEKMEIFLTLMGTMRRQLHQLQEKENKNKRKRTTSSGAAGWIPVFQPEDFTTEVEFKKHLPIVYPIEHPVTAESTSAGPNLELTL
ncbi:hypothetical protein OROGR_019199 [Orobanche gracilis]